MKKNILAENMRRFGTKNLVEEYGGVEDKDSMETWANKWVEITNKFIDQKAKENPDIKYPRASMTKKGSTENISYTLNVPGQGTTVNYTWSDVKNRGQVSPEGYNALINNLLKRFVQYSKIFSNDPKDKMRRNQYQNLEWALQRGYNAWKQSWLANTSQVGA